MENLIQPTKIEQKLSQRFLEAIKHRQSTLRFTNPDQVRIRIDNEDDVILIPKRIFDLWFGIMQHISAGNGVSIIKSEAYISTQQAADILKISRPSIIKLIDNGDIPAKKVGSHRRILLSDLEHYQRRVRQSLSKSLNASPNASRQSDLDLN